MANHITHPFAPDHGDYVEVSPDHCEITVGVRVDGAVRKFLPPPPDVLPQRDLERFRGLVGKPVQFPPSPPSQTPPADEEVFGFPQEEHEYVDLIAPPGDDLDAETIENAFPEEGETDGTYAEATAQRGERVRQEAAASPPLFAGLTIANRARSMFDLTGNAGDPPYPTPSPELSANFGPPPELYRT